MRDAVRRPEARAAMLFASVTSLFLLCTPLGARAQDILSSSAARFVHESWTASTGLPVNQLSSALQSRDGYLWFSTFDGLVRFDGVRFSVFNSGNSPDLPTNRLTGLWEDAMGRLWIQSEQGHLIERSGAAFVDHTSAVGGGPVTTVHVDSVDVWAGTPSGIYRLADTTFVPLHHGQIDGVVLSVFVDSRDDLWIGTSDGGLYLASARGMEPPVQIEGLGSNDVHSLSESPDGSLWIAGHLGSFTLEIEDLGQDPPRPLPPYPPGLTIPTSFHFPEDGPVWVQAWGGMWALVDGAWKAPRDGPGGRLDPVIGVPGPDGRRWAYDPYRVYVDGEELFVSERRLERIQFDHEGTVWASGEGLHMFRPAVVDQRGGRDGLVDNVYVIHEDRQGRIWFGSMGGGLVRLDAEGVHRYPTGPPSGLSNIAMAVHQDRRGDVWVGLWDGGVCRLDGDACAENGIDRLGGRIVRGVHEDRTGSLWFGTDDGVAVRGPEGEWRHLGTADGLPHADVRTFAEDRAGRVWMGTYGGGVVRWNGEVLETPGFELSSDVIRSLYMGVDGVLWVGTEGRGLNRVVPADRTDIQGSPEGGLTHAVGPTGRPATETVRSPDRPTTDDERPPARRMLDASVTVYRVADGLFDEGIHQIVEDDFARLWMSSNRGIFRVAKEDLTDFAEGRSELVHSISYTERNGLLNREMNGGVNSAGIKDRRGHIWFGGIEGVVRIDPATVRSNDIPPPVVIEEVISARRVQPADGAPIALAPRERDFEVSYTALSFVAPENVRFRYRLDGFNAGWIDAGSRRNAFYTNVPPGDYIFRVVASNNDGVWNEEGAAVTVTVAPYFHETWTARVGLVLAGMLLAAAAVRYRDRRHRRRSADLEDQVRERTRTIEKQAELLRDLDEAKSTFFANLSHELRTPLTLTIGPLEDVRDGLHGPLSDGVADDVDLALRSSRRLLRLVNQMLDVARLESGQMELRAVKADLNTLVARLVRAFTPLAERRSIALTSHEEGDAPEVSYDPDLMEKVFTNILSNALKFTPEGGAVRVMVETIGDDEITDRVRVSVKDSGPGISKDDLPHLFDRFQRGHASRRVPGIGIGLSLAKELVDLHGGAIDVKSDPGFGATFSVTLRVGTAHLPSHALAVDVDAREVSLEGVPFMDVRLGSDRTPAAERDEASDQPLVLVVDDNADVRSFVGRHLSASFRVVEAADGMEAITHARREVPDLIVTDVIMPEMDGLELLSTLRGDPELDFIPVVLLSARADVEDRIRGLEVGADDYLTKPFQAAELKARVANLIRSRQRLRERRTVVELRVGEIEVESVEDRFLADLSTVIEKRMSDEDFDVEVLAGAMGLSRSALYRRLAALDVGSPADLIRSMRLDRAAQLLAGRAGSVSEVAYGVGFKSVSHFSRSFRGRFGVTPSGYRDGRSIDES